MEHSFQSFIISGNFDEGIRGKSDQNQLREVHARRVSAGDEKNEDGLKKPGDGSVYETDSKNGTHPFWNNWSSIVENPAMKS